MASALNKKLFRDIIHLRGQILATALVVTCGVASFVSMRSTYASLLATQQDYYSEYRFADIFAHLTRAPGMPSFRDLLDVRPSGWQRSGLARRS